MLKALEFMIASNTMEKESDAREHRGKNEQEAEMTLDSGPIYTGTVPCGTVPEPHG